MPPTPDRGSVRSAAAVNATIRAVATGARGRAWTDAERALYGLLLEEWEQARRAEEMAAAA